MGMRLGARWGVGLLLLGAGTASGQTIVYDTISTVSSTGGWGGIIEEGESSSRQERPDGFEADDEYGDVIAPATSNRFVTRFDMWLNRGSQSLLTRAAVRLTIWNLSGLTPTTAVWSGTSPVTTLPPGIGVFTFAPNVLVPNTFAFSMGIEEAEWAPGRLTVAGPAFTGGAPTVGTSLDGLIFRNSDTGVWGRESGTPALENGNVRARVWAVPAPSAVALLGAAGLIATRRRR